MRQADTLTKKHAVDTAISWYLLAAVRPALGLEGQHDSTHDGDDIEHSTLLHRGHRPSFAHHRRAGEAVELGSPNSQAHQKRQREGHTGKEHQNKDGYRLDKEVDFAPPLRPLSRGDFELLGVPALDEDSDDQHIEKVERNDDQEGKEGQQSGHNDAHLSVVLTVFQFSQHLNAQARPGYVS